VWTPGPHFSPPPDFSIFSSLPSPSRPLVPSLQEAQLSKPPIQRYADRIASRFTPSVMLLATLVAVVWLAVGFAGWLPPSYLSHPGEGRREGGKEGRREGGVEGGRGPSFCRLLCRLCPSPQPKLLVFLVPPQTKRPGYLPSPSGSRSSLPPAPVPWAWRRPRR